MAAMEEHEDSSKVILSLCAGADLTKGQIVFTHDSKYFSCCSGSAVKVFNTTNGQCTKVLEGHSDVVTGLAINPANKLQLFSCGLDGQVIQWIFLEGVMLRTYAFHIPLYAIITVDDAGTCMSAIAHRPQAANSCLLRLPLEKKKSPEGAAVRTGDIILPVCSSDHRAVGHGGNGQYLAAVHGQELSVYSFQRKTCKKLTTEANNPFTCVACHPTDVCIATGHANGMITFWWNVLTKDKVVKSTNHWHSLPVRCLAFSPEGSSLLSGGQECVLVRWQVNSQVKDFLPRLGAPLHSVVPSPDGAMYVTSHTDNVLQVISSSFTILHAMRGLARAHLGTGATTTATTSTPMPVGLVCDPRSGALVTNGRPGHLQFYSMETDCQLYNLDIVGQNYVSSTTADEPATVTEVERAAFDPSGDWLATFQRWEDFQFSPEYCLKFWRYNKKQQNYQLNTTVETPHYKSIRCLRFKPGQAKQSEPPVMVSTGEDGVFKLWSLVTETVLGKPVQQWACQSMGCYRNRPSGAARFAADGTTLAVAFDSVLTLWDPETNVLMDTVPMNQPILCMEFGGEGYTHFLLVTTTSHLTVLDLRTVTVHRQVAMRGALLATDGDLVCAVTSEQDLYVFRLDDDRPLLMKKKAMSHPVVSAIFLPHSGQDGEGEGELSWQRRCRLYLLDSRQMLFSPTLPSAKALTPLSRMQAQLKQVLPQTPIQAVLSSHRGQEVTTTSSSTSQTDQQPLRPLAGFDVMNDHILSTNSFSKRALGMLETMLVKRKGAAESMEVETTDGGEDDVAMVTPSS